MTITEISLKKPVTVLMVMATIFVLGYIASSQIPLEFLPETTGPNFWVLFPYPNATPAEVEKAIAVPAEELLSTVPGLTSVDATAGRDRCSLTLEFNWDTDMDYAYLEVKDRLDRLKADLPKECWQYMIWRFSSNDIPIMWAGLDWEGSSDALYDLADSRLKPAIERIDGVGSVTVWGQESRRIFIDIDQDRLKNHGVNLYELVLGLERYNFNISSGEITAGGSRYLVRAVNEYRSIDDIREIPVGRRGLKLADLADVRYDYPEAVFLIRMDGNQSIVLELKKESRANTVEVCRKVREALEAFTLSGDFPGLSSSIIFDQSEYILNSFAGLRDAGVIGSILAVLVLIYFLRRLRITLIIAFAIPVSVLVAVTVMYFIGVSLNVVSMVGLMLAVGMLVDNSIVVSENVFRLRESGESWYDAARDGSRQVSMAIMASTLTTIIVFLPLIFMKLGMARIYMREVGIPISLALLASLLIALTFIPLVSTRILKGSSAPTPMAIQRAGRRYADVLRWSIDHKLNVILLMVFLGFLTWKIPVAGTMEKKQGENADPRQIMIEMRMVGSFDVGRAVGAFEEIEAALAGETAALDIAHILCMTAPFRDLGRVNIYMTDAEVETITTMEAIDRVEALLPDLPGISFTVRKEVGMSGGEASDESLLVRGYDPEVLAALAERVRRRLGPIESITNLSTDVDVGKDEIEISVDRELVEKYGVPPLVAAQTVAFGLRGYQLHRLKGDEREIDVNVRLEKADRENVEKLKDLQLTGRTGQQVPLGVLADFRTVPGLRAIRRSEGKRYITVKWEPARGELADKAPSETKRKIEAALEGFVLPEGYTIEFGQGFVDIEEMKKTFIQAFLLSVLLIYFLLGGLFESYIQPLAILVSVPLAFVGSLWILYATGTPLDVAAYIGFILLIGIVVNNAIVIVDHINILRKSGMPRREAIIQGGRDRFRPVLMTAITTILGLLPLAWGSSSVGGIIMFASMGRAVIGGLITSTILTLLMVPVFYALFDDLVVWGHSLLGKPKQMEIADAQES